MSSILSQTKFSSKNYDLLLEKWSKLSLQNGINFSVGSTKYSPKSQKYKDLIVNKFHWNIADGGVTFKINTIRNYTIFEGENITFDASKSSYSEGRIVSYQWEYNGTVISTEATFDFNDFSAGKEIVRLTIETDDGSILSGDIFITVYSTGRLKPFISTWETDWSKKVTIPTIGEGYNYSIDWGDGKADFNITGRISHMYAIKNKYKIKIWGKLPRLYSSESSYYGYLESIDQWGDIEWKSMSRAFSASGNLEGKAHDTPNLSNVTDMSRMFYYSSFNQDIGDWDVSNVTDMSSMFSNSSFNQDIGDWDVSNVTDMSSMFYNSSFSTKNYDLLLEKWSQLSLQNGVEFSVGSTKYSPKSQKYKDLIVNKFHWNIIDGGSILKIKTRNFYTIIEGESITFDASESSYSEGEIISYKWKSNDILIGNKATFEFNGFSVGKHIVTLTIETNDGFTLSSSDIIVDVREKGVINPFITKWNLVDSSDLTITIPTKEDEWYDYEVDWGDGKKDSNVTGDISHTYGSTGEYIIKITGVFPKIYFKKQIGSIPYTSKSNKKIVSVEQWGTQRWHSMEGAFSGLVHLLINAEDTPDLLYVESMKSMFNNCNLINGGNIGLWDVSHVKDMSYMFFYRGAGAFNKDISQWNVSNVTNMSYMFAGDVAADEIQMNKFNQDISSWNVSNVTNMSGMFYMSNFNQDIGNWDVSNVTDMNNMFYVAEKFNQDISNWDVSKVTNMQDMIGGRFKNQEEYGSTLFNQNLANWDISNVKNMVGMFEDSNLSTSNYDNILNGWAKLSLQNNVVFTPHKKYSKASKEARASIISNFNWAIEDAGMVE